MSYKAKPIYLLNPREGIYEIREAMNSFSNTWLPMHSSEDSLVLYHYTTLDGLKGILHNRSIWFSHISTLNDPLELQYGKKTVIDKLKIFIEKEEDSNIKIIMKNLITDIEAFDTVLYHSYVACFCENDNLLSQWRGYAGKSGGYNLGISLETETKFSHNSENLTDDSYIILRRLIYQPDDQNDIIEKYISLIIKGARKAIKRMISERTDLPDGWTYQASMDAANLLFDIIMSLKNQVFSEEKEWRLIKVRAGSHLPELLKFRESGGNLIPYLDTFIFNNRNDKIEFPLQSIRFGPMLEEVRTKSSIELLMNNKASLPHPISINPIGINISGAGYFLR